jgi:dTDP-4-amino-4,6-dideoxygalactose transaminase
MSAAIQSARARETVQQNLYLWPRYDESLQKDLAHFTEGHSFGSWTLGDLYDEVPGAFARKMGLKYGLFASTGTAGLHAVLMALGLQPGDEVIVPSMTFIRAASPLTHLSLQPVIADVDKDTGLIDPVSIEANITPKTRAVIMVHMWGLAADCQKISRICKHHDLLLIEDFSQAHFSRYKNKYVGSFGDASFASLQRKKCISVGEGGIVVTRHKDVFERLKKITAPGSFDSDFAGYGLNMRMSPFSAVAVKNLLPKVETFIRDKQAAVHNMVPLLEQQPELLQPMTIPSYLRPEDISWYAYKPTLNHATLKKLQQKRLWKFGELGYGNISQDQYWKGDERYFPFSLGIRAVVRTPLPGHAAYIKDRITLNIPTVPAEYWDEAHINSWKKELGV